MISLDEEEFLKVLNREFGITGEDVFTLGGGTFTVNGVTVDTRDKDTFRRTLKQALDTNNEDPLGILK